VPDPFIVVIAAASSALLLLFWTTAMGRRWNARHERSRSLEEGQRAEWTRAAHSDRRAARRAARRGERAPTPEGSALVRARAEDVIHRWENPWDTIGSALLTAVIIVNGCALAFHEPAWGWIVLCVLGLAPALALFSARSYLLRTHAYAHEVNMPPAGENVS